MEKSNIKSNSATIAVLCFVVMLAIGYFFINPMIAELKDTSVKLSAKTTEISDINTKINAINNLKSALASSKDKVKKISLAAPASDNMPEIIASLDNMASQSSLKIISIQPSKDSVNGVVPVTTVIQGDYSGFTNFMSKIENGIRPMNIKSISIASAPTSDGGALINFTLNLEILRVE